MSDACYVYAIGRPGASLPDDLRGLDDRPLSVVALRDLEAVVSEIVRERLQASAENVLRHEFVIEAVRRVRPAIPVRFGTVLSDAEAVATA